MRVLVVGAGGFVGRELVRCLADRHDVTALDRHCGEIIGARIVEGDFADKQVLERAFASGCDVLVHLATIPGGAAELEPELAWNINVEATRRLFAAAAGAGRAQRIVFASSIAALGDPLPDPVTDATPLRPRMYYGAHKAMMEQWLGTLQRRGDVEAVSLRLSGIVGRPRGSVAMKSAFMSDVFHAAMSGETFTSPVSAKASMWMMSVHQIVRNLIQAIERDAGECEPDAVTLPAVEATMGDLVAEIARQTSRDPDFVSYAPDPALEAMFGRFPRLAVQAAPAMGFADDGSLKALVARTLHTIGGG